MSAVSLKLNKMHFPVSTLGPGKRMGLWFNGCSIHCEGCISRDTWEFSESSRIELAAVFEVLESWLPQADGLTISGGEPFDQAGALGELLSWFERRRGEREVLVYSGYEFSVLTRRHGALLEKIDALVSGPYEVNSGQSKRWWGSDNQQLHLLSERARIVYAGAEEADQAQRKLDVFEEDGQWWFAGVPRSQDWLKVRGMLEQKGVSAKFSHVE